MNLFVVTRDPMDGDLHSSTAMDQSAMIMKLCTFSGIIGHPRNADVLIHSGITFECLYNIYLDGLGIVYGIGFDLGCIALL